MQVFDCGCIGEGALHIVAASKKHLKPGGRIIPSSAQVSVGSGKPATWFLTACLPACQIQLNCYHCYHCACRCTASPSSLAHTSRSVPACHMTQAHWLHMHGSQTTLRQTSAAVPIQHQPHQQQQQQAHMALPGRPLLPLSQCLPLTSTHRTPSPPFSQQSSTCSLTLPHMGCATQWPSGLSCSWMRTPASAAAPTPLAPQHPAQPGSR